MLYESPLRLRLAVSRSSANLKNCKKAQAAFLEPKRDRARGVVAKDLRSAACIKDACHTIHLFGI